MRRATVRVDRGIVEIKNVDGAAVPVKPWPQSFYVSRSMLVTDAVEVRPLTFTGLFKGVGKNFVTMNFWRLCWILRGLGFLTTDECARYHWRQLTFKFWRHQQVHRFRWVRWLLSPS